MALQGLGLPLPGMMGQGAAEGGRGRTRTREMRRNNRREVRDGDELSYYGCVLVNELVLLTLPGV